MPHKQYFKVHCWECLVVQVMFHALKTSLMTSPGHKVGQILKSTYLRQYLSYSADRKLKISEMRMVIFVVYLTSRITSDKNVCRELKEAAILKILKYHTQLQLDFGYEKIVPYNARKCIYHVDDVTGWPKRRPFIFLYKWNNKTFLDN